MTLDSWIALHVLRGELCQVVGEEDGLVAGAADGDVAEARVKQVRGGHCYRRELERVGGKGPGSCDW
jgi:hypothetical protein